MKRTLKGRVTLGHERVEVPTRKSKKCNFPVIMYVGVCIIGYWIRSDPKVQIPEFSDRKKIDQKISDIRIFRI